MAVNTPTDVQDRLDASIVWRRIEMLAMRSELERAANASPGAPLARALARAGVAMLYAHWEGFFRDACQTYVDYVARRRPKYGELNDGLLLTVLAALQRRSDSGDDAATVALLEAVRDSSTSRARIPRQMINTKSNLRHAVAAETLKSIGLPEDMFLTRAPMIDKSLCDARNAIAHGRDHFLTPDEFQRLHDEIMDMMTDLKSEVVAAARTSAYLTAASTRS